MKTLLRGSDAGKPIPPSTLPRFRWPSQRRLTPTHCGHCGVRLLVADVPTADDPIAHPACVMCGRVACELVADGYRRLTAEEFAALPINRQRRSGGPKPRDPSTLPTCCDCGQAPASRRWRLCDACMTARQKASAIRANNAYRARQREAAS